MANVRIEQHFKISAELLRRHGLFSPEEVACTFEFEHGRFFFSVDQSNTTLKICLPEEVTASFVIPLNYAWLKKGCRHYLCCTRCYGNFNELHLVYDHWLCRRCSGGRISAKGPSPYERRVLRIERGRDRLLGLDGAGPARGRNRDKIAAALIADPLTARLHPDLMALLEAQARREISRKRKAAKLRHWPELTTAHALALGAPTAPPVMLAEAHDTGLIYIDGAWAPEVPSAADDGLGILEQHPSLDVRVLSRRWNQQRNVRWAHTLVWPEACGISEMLVVAELRAKSDPHLLVITQVRSMSKTTQKIGLCPVPAAGGGTRWFFICGLTGKRCELLSLRNEFFASPKAQRLVHQSQRGLVRGLGSA
jgi:hypothetical protein